MPMQSLISRDFLSVEKFSGCLQLRWAVNFQLSLLPPSLGVTWKNKKNWACYLVVCLLRSFLRCTSEWKKKGKLKVARAFLRLPALDFWSVRYSHWILSIRWICSVMLCLFCSSTCGAPNISVSIVTIFGKPRLLFLQTIPSVSPFSRSPSGAERVLPPNLHRGSPQGAQVLRFEDFHCCCSYSLVVFMFLLSSLADFDRLPLCFGPVVAAHLNSFRSRGINLGFFCCFDRSSCLCCGIRFGCVAFNRFIHEISLVDMLFGLIQLVPALFGCVACSVLCSCCSVVWFLDLNWGFFYSVAIDPPDLHVHPLES